MRFAAALYLALALLFPFACSSDDTTGPSNTTPPQPSALAIVSGNNQTGTVGTLLPDSLVVKVTGAQGQAISGVSVQWAVTGGSSLNATATSTNSAGQAKVGWTLGTKTATDTVTASVTGLMAVTLTATGTPDRPAKVKASRDSLTLTTVGDTARLTAAVADRYDNSIDSASVEWSSSDTLVAQVDTDGLVTSRGGGAANITAASDTAQAAIKVKVTGVPDTVFVHGGAGQTGPAGEPLTDSLAVKVTDAFGNAVSGVTITFTPRSGSGSVSPASSVTDAAGLGMTEWTLGQMAGTDSVYAAVTGLGGSPVHFTATAAPNGTITGTLTLTSNLQSLTLASSTASGGMAPRSAAGLHRDAPGAVSRTTAAAITGTATPQRPEYVPGTLIVTYRNAPLSAPPPGASAYASAATARAVANEVRTHLAARAAAHGFDVSGVSPAILAARIRVDPARLDEVRAALLQDPAVAAVEREGIAHAVGPRLPDARPAVALGTVPNDPLYRPQMWHYNVIDLPAAWNITTGSRSVLVAVVDDGIRFDHPSVAANLTADGYDFVSQIGVSICGFLMDQAGDGDGYDSDPTIPVKYDESTCNLSTSGGHGLHVAGTIGAAGNDGYGVTGVNWSVRIRPVRVLGISGGGSTYDITQGILYAAGLPADDGAGGTVQAPSAADIINLSLGAVTGSLDLQNAVQAAANAGALLLAAAGNEGVSTPMYPAAYPEVLSVSAIGPDWQRASYSNYGATIDIAAPGGDIADGNTTFGVASATWNFDTNTPNHDFFQGTSMAAPHVSGVAALLLAHNPSLPANQLRARLLDYAVDLGPVGWDQDYGFGLVNARNSLTQTLGPSRDRYARLYDAENGAILKTIPAEPEGTYTFSALDDGSYYVFAGRDDEGDQQIGVPGRRWGAFGSGTATPVPIIVSGAGTHSSSFSVGWPYESEPNNSLSEANRLVIGGYLYGQFATTSDVDVYRITVPSGQYTFETLGWQGACGFAVDADTVLELYDGNGILIAINDDIDPATYNYCSQIIQTLQAGTYELRVTYVSGGGGYRLQARAGT